MSSQPLLGGNGNSSSSNNKSKDNDHPIFLRVAHSPWTKINQNTLKYTRGAIAAYLVVTALMQLDYELEVNKHGWGVLFDFEDLTYWLETVYHIIAFVWTLMHLHYPHHASEESSMSTKTQKFFSPPKQRSASKGGIPINKAVFSIFYYAATTFPLLVSVVHLAVEMPMGKAIPGAHDSFHSSWFAGFYTVTKYATNSVIALVEILVLSSIKRPNPLWLHCAAFALIILVYIAWANIGHLLAPHRFSYFWLDFYVLGWEHVIGYAAAFIAGSIALLGFNYGLTTLREQTTKKQRKGDSNKNKNSSSDYSRLGQ